MKIFPSLYVADGKKIQTIDIVGLSNDLFNKTKDSTLQSD